MKCTSSFMKSIEQLEAEQQERFAAAIDKLIGGLQCGAYHRELDIDRLQKSVYEASPDLQRLDREIRDLTKVKEIFEHK